jgi:hypothetical protein
LCGRASQDKTLGNVAMEIKCEILGSVSVPFRGSHPVSGIGDDDDDEMGMYYVMGIEDIS